MNFFLSYQINFPNISSLCFNGTDVHFPTKNDQAEFESIKREYTKAIVELLSEKKLNERRFISSSINYARRVLINLSVRFDLLKITYSTDYYNKLLNPISDLINDAVDFTHLLNGYFVYDQFPDKDSLKFGIKKQNEVKKLKDLILNLNVSNENQTLAFHDDKISQIYISKLVSVSNFTLNRSSKLINDFSSTSTLYYDVVLPFNNKNYDEIHCTPYWDLPDFFKGLYVGEE